MRFYLIQRGTFKDKISYNDITGIDSIMDFGYMGSSEFEWGALPYIYSINPEFKNLKEFISWIEDHGFSLEDCDTISII